jgi:hypothetical protein
VTAPLSSAWRSALAGLVVGVVLVGGAALWAAFSPFDGLAGEELFEIPKGTYARRMAGDQVEILPDTIHLTLGVRSVLLLRNADEVPQIFGPTLIMPGQSFRLPFEVASTYSFACSAHASGQMRVVVAPAPRRGWEALSWRTERWLVDNGLLAKRTRAVAS